MPDLDRDWELLRQQLNAPYLVNAQGPLGRIYAAFQAMQDEMIPDDLRQDLLAILEAHGQMLRSLSYEHKARVKLRNVQARLTENA